MEVRYSETTRMKAQITKREAIRIAIATLRIEFDIPQHSWVSGIKEDDEHKLMKSVEHCGGSHSWNSKEIHRTARPEDNRVLEVISYLLLADQRYVDAGDFS